MDITIPYYEDNTRINNTAIGWFLFGGPSYFHKKMSGEIPGEETRAMAKGTMIHMYLLQPDEFSKHYKVADYNKPKSVQQENFCNALIDSVEIDPDLALLEAYKRSYSIIGKSDAKMLSEAKEIASTLKFYIHVLQDKDVTYISSYDLSMLQKIRQNVEEHVAAKELLDCPTAKHEFHINWDMSGTPCKSLLDSVDFNTRDKICTIMDLKTTVHLYGFETSVKQYDYFRQFEFYRMAAEWYIRNELHSDSEGWTFRVYIIAIDTVSDNAVRVFEFTPEQLESRHDDIVHALFDIAWHGEHGTWDHTRAYYESNGIEYLNL